MKLLGLNLHKEGSAVNKILKSGWYPFGAYEKPDFWGHVEQKKGFPREIQEIYTSSPNGPKISVNAIVGKNGAGKSSLIEIMFRIINNFAITLLGAERAKDGQRWLRHAYGVHADLHYEIDGQQYKLTCRNLNVNLYLTAKDSPPQWYLIRKSQDANKVLKNFFYTIVTNYSLYAYNEQDYTFEAYRASNKKVKGGEWISGLFHKNDGYFTPLVLTPYRTNGNLDINKESLLASQRILQLAIMAHLHGKQLIPNYQPYELSIGLKPLDLKKTVSELDSKLPKKLKDLSADFLIDIISREWCRELRGSKHRKVPLDTDKTIFPLALRYLAVKTLKVALSYKDYGNILCKDIVDNETDLNFRENCICSNISNLIAKIRKDFVRKGEHNHLTLKIEQTYSFLMDFLRQKKFRWDDGQKVRISQLVEDIPKDSYGYSQIFTYLPPPIFKVDIKFRRMEEVSETNWELSSRKTLTLSQLSSGERQLLYSISYVLYHLKNIESIQDDDERVAYRHICLIFDEIELYFHPEYQRTFIARLVEAIDWCSIDRSRIESIQIVLITHSPFVLTDVFNHNILYLNENGRPVKVRDETFGANYYTLLNKSFFFDKSAVGVFSSGFLRDIVVKARHGFPEVRKLLPFSGDEIVRNIILELLDSN